MLASPDKKTAKKALQPVASDDRHTYRIRAEGNRIQLWLNGVRTVDFVEKDTAIARSEIIAVQIHGGMKAVIAYKDIEIEELPTLNDRRLKDQKLNDKSKQSAAPVKPDSSSVNRFGDANAEVSARPPFTNRQFSLGQGEVVVFTGQTDLVRSRRDSTLEAMLATNFADAKPRFRNMAWEGDTVYEQWRDLDFGTWEDQLRDGGAGPILADGGT